jgi:hypothetical protein
MLLKLAVDRNGGRRSPEVDVDNRFPLLDEPLEVTDFLRGLNLDDEGILVVIPEDPAVELEGARHYALWM